MGERYLSFAAYAHYTKGKSRSISKQGIGIKYSLWQVGDKAHIFSVETDGTRKNCGCIYANDKDLEEVFSGDADFVTNLIANCELPYWKRDSKMNPHCPIEFSSLRGKICTDICGAGTISCRLKPVEYVQT
jgi:hypothetical protein